MFLVAGLGNFGDEYQNTRHNIGFMAADEIVRRYRFSAFKSKFEGLVAEGQIAGEKVLLLKPQTFMNASGRSIVQCAFFYKIIPENIIVIHDDIDLKVGQVKAKIGGGSGGHNGLKSIDSAITPQYNRIRIGIGRPDNGGSEVIDYVLHRFSKQDEPTIYKAIDLATQALEVLIANGIDSCSSFLGQNKL